MTSLRDKSEEKPAWIKHMSKGYDTHMMDVMHICAESWESVTLQHIAWCRKSCDILSVCDVADLTLLNGDNIGEIAEGEEVAHLLSLMMQLTLDKTEYSFIDSYIAVTASAFYAGAE